MVHNPKRFSYSTAAVIAQLRRLLRRLGNAHERVEQRVLPEAPAGGDRARDLGAVRELDLAPNDQLLAVLHQAPHAIDLETLRLDSPMVQRLRAQGVRLAVPLLSQGVLIGLLALGPRRSEQDYSADDRTLLAGLATQAAPALRVAQLVRRQHAEARERERIAQELRIARFIQQTLLPRELPTPAGWTVTAYYEPAREVGGDFYDVVRLPDGRLGLLIADVTDKGVPAALMMATARSVVRTAALQGAAPGTVLGQVNDLLVGDMPSNMFVTCFYALLDPTSGQLRFANAGHDYPFVRRTDGSVHELDARGMPLGLMHGMEYAEGHIRLGPGDRLLLYSDGLVEAHNQRREMFSFARLAALLGGAEHGGQRLIDVLLGELACFTGPGWLQEDDITLLALERAARDDRTVWQSLAELTIASVPGNERPAAMHVDEAVAEVGLTPRNRERLQTAVAEATMNAMEHGNGYRADRPVHISVRRSPDALSVRVFDAATGPIGTPDVPDLEAKLAGRQVPRGWGVHLIRHLVDELHDGFEDGRHVVELIVTL